MGRPVVSWIDHHARRTPDRIALVDLASGRETSYGRLAARIRALAYALATRYGITAGERVAVLSRNDTRVLEVIHACAVLGAVAVPLNWRLTESELAGVGADAELALLIHESASGPLAAAVAARAGVPRTLAWSSDGGPDDYERLIDTGAPADWLPAEVDDDAVWTIIYTSGTTGRPKGVQATHANVLACLLGILVAHRVHADSRCLVVLPMFHVAGLNLFTNPVLYAGGTVLVARGFDPAQTLRLVTADVTHFCGVPANYQFMQQLPEWPEAGLRPFVAVVGGSPVPPALVAAWSRRGVALTTVFGITEAGACVTAVPPGQEPGAPGTVGVPTLYARCRIRSATGSPPAPGEPGELQLHGALVTPGYWRNAAATAAAFTEDGWLRTGDAATFTADGHLVLVDRWKDMFISGGENVYPAEVENALHEHPAVSQAAVVGTPHPKWGETGVAFVVPDNGSHVSAGELVEWCRDRLAPYKVPTRIVLVGELPRNATGKILKGPLREQAAATAR